MKNKKYIIIFALIAVMLLSGCTGPVQLVMNKIVPDSQEKIDIMTDIAYKVYDEEYTELYEMINSSLEVDKTECIEKTKEIREILSEPIQNINLYHYNVVLSNDKDGEKVKYKTCTFTGNTKGRSYYLTANFKEKSGVESLVGYNIYENLNYVVNNSILKLGAKEWFLIIWTLIALGLRILAFILCLRDNIRRKVLWLLIIVCNFTITISILPNRFSSSVSIFDIMGISKYDIYANGGRITVVAIPIFAILFLLIRKTLIKKHKIYLTNLYEKRQKEEEMKQQKILEVKTQGNINIDENAQLQD